MIAASIPARIALVVDAPGSTLAGVAHTVPAALPKPLDVEILYLSDYEAGRSATPGAATELFNELYCGAYDLVHTFAYGFAERVFDPAIAAEPALHDPNHVLDRVLRLPLTVSVHDETILDRPVELERVRERFAVIASGTHVPALAATTWAAFFADVLAATRVRSGPMSEAAVWERVKAWNARVERVCAARGIP